MKRLFIPLLALLFFAACKKNIKIESGNSAYLERLKTELADSLSKNDFQNLDFQKARLFNSKTKEQQFLLVPLLNKKPNEDFLILKIEKAGLIDAGRFVRLERSNPRHHLFAIQMGWQHFY